MKINIVASCVLAGTLCFALSAAAVERRFAAAMDAVNPAQQTVTLRHKPTGFTADAVWNANTKVVANIKYDIDDVPEGWVECWAATVDADGKTISEIGLVRPLAKEASSAQAGPVKEKTTFRAKLLRVPPGAATLNSVQPLLTRKGDAAYELDVNGARWKLTTRKKRRPSLNRDVPFAAAGLKPGLACLEAAYREEAAGNKLTLLRVLPAPPKFRADEPTAGVTGATAANLEKEMARLRTAFAKLAPEVKKVAPVMLRVAPELTLPGEPVKLAIEAWAQKLPNAQAELETNYLQASAVKKVLALPWKANEQVNNLTRYTAEVALKDLPVGQHLMRWRCDVGGDIQDFWRSFAVTDAKKLVVMLHFTAGKPNKEFEQYHLPYDYWDDSSLMYFSGPFGERKTPRTAAEWMQASREYRRCGANPNVQIFQGNYAGRTGWPAPIPVQFCTEPEDVQRAVFKASLELSALLGFRPEDLGFAAYEFGTRTVAIAREAGVKLIGSLCIHQNWQDGSWGINHTARPLRPYFVAADDFRKPGAGGANGLVMVSQHDKSILWTEYGLGVFEPAWLEEAWTGGGGGGRAEQDEIFMSRQLDLMEGALQNVANQRVPYFQSIGIEGFKWAIKPNALMLDYLGRRAARGEMVFCNAGVAGDFYRRHYRETPETLFCDADYWCGMKATDSILSTWKPVVYPDLMQIENAHYAAFFKRPAALPEYHWDYTQPWKYPDWGNEDLPRSTMGFLVPGEHDKFAVTPKITDTRPLKVHCESCDAAGGLEVVVTLETPAALKAFPLALWDLPREWKTGDGWWRAPQTARFVPVRAPFTGNLNGILEVDAQPGRNEFRLLITTPPRAPASLDLAVDSVRGKVFERDGAAMAYVWPMRPWDMAFELEVPAGRSAHYFAAPKGEQVDLSPGKHRLVIAKEHWSRITGLTRAELLLAIHAVKEGKTNESESKRSQ